MSQVKCSQLHICSKEMGVVKITHESQYPDFLAANVQYNSNVRTRQFTLCSFCASKASFFPFPQYFPKVYACKYDTFEEV